MVANEDCDLAQKRWPAPWLGQKETMAEHLKEVHGLRPRRHQEVIESHRPDNWAGYTTQVSAIDQEVVEPRRGYSGAWPSRKDKNIWAQHPSAPVKRSRRLKRTRRTGIKSKHAMTKLPKFGPANLRAVNPNLEARHRARVYNNLKSTMNSLK